MLGNTPTVYLGSLAILAAFSAGMAAYLLRRSLDLQTTVAVVVVGLLPTMPLPGASIGGYTSSIYMPLERIGLLAAVLLWAPPSKRGLWTSLAMGAVLGFCQGIRFGSGAVAVAAIALVDQAAVFERGSRTPAREAVRASAAVLGGFLLSQAAWIVWAAIMLPRPHALEFLWPLQMWETHRNSGAARWPTWGGWRMAITQYTMPVTAAALCVGGVPRWIRTPASGRTSAWESHGAANVLLVFFALASLFYFRHEHHFRQFAWMLVPGAAAALATSRRTTRLVVLGLCAPAVWPIASALAPRPSSDVARLEVPRGYAVFVPPDTVSRVRFLDPFTRLGPVMFVPNGAGWLYAFDVAHVSRHTWFYSRAVVRPFEEETFARDAASATTVIRCDPPNGGGAWPLPPSAVAAIEQRYVLVASAGGCRVWAPRGTGTGGGQ